MGLQFSIELPENGVAHFRDFSGQKIQVGRDLNGKIFNAFRF